MFYQEDFILRQITMLIQFVAKTVFGKDHIEYKITDENVYVLSDDIHSKIKRLLKEYKICEAEDLLFENLVDKTNVQYLKMAVDFYQRLNQLSDSVLEGNNFSRAEIEEGLKKVCDFYDIDNLYNE